MFGKAVHRARHFVVAGLLTFLLCSGARGAEPPSTSETLAAMKRAATYYRTKVATRGGYVYYYSLDLTQRWGEGVATQNQIWVQPPGTPTVGLAYLAAWRATGDKFYLEAATETARALVYGQLVSGGWTNAIDFDPRGNRVAGYRNGKGRGKINSTLDDGISQSALTLLMRVDQALEFKDAEIHNAAKFALDALLAAQFPNGGFPQVWTAASESRPVVKAVYPKYDWRTENRIKAYWNQYTLNDNLAGDVSDMLIAAHEIYRDDRALAALNKLGEFLILAQMPDPQPAWAQQYDVEMRPVWARRFEPPAIAGRESQNAIETLMKISRKTNDRKFLEPIPRAIGYLKKSLLPDGRVARFYELGTNKPLYMTKDYQLTHDDSEVPSHYGWKSASALKRLEAEYAAIIEGKPAPIDQTHRVPSADQLVEIISSLDAEGRWVSTADRASLVGQPKFTPGSNYLSSEVFSRNLTALSAYVAAGKEPLKK